MADLITFECIFLEPGEESYSVYFDDDGRVAYAYLLNQVGRIVADVWLYNRCDTPVEPEWRDPARMPFANPKAYVHESEHHAFRAVQAIADVRVNWCVEGENAKAQVIIRGKLFATLLEGRKPGCSLLACKDGPLAMVLRS